MSKKWQLWSRSPDCRYWLVIDEGTEKHCKEGAEFRVRTGAKAGIKEGDYVALPAGEVPIGSRAK